MPEPEADDAIKYVVNLITLLVYGKPAACLCSFFTFQGMDLYFKRHDGQAVTCEDFFSAMRDANGADFANFLQWSVSDVCVF